MSRRVAALPERLPEGERLLWQGAPDWRVLARTAFHVRGLAMYFAVLLAWSAASSLRSGVPLAATAAWTLRLAAIAAVPIALLALYAWATSRATTYTVTDKRVAVRLGLALPMTINLPFSRIDGAAFRPGRDGAGDITLQLARGHRLAYFMLWPHAKPWRMGRPEPMLRAVPEAAVVAQLLARALAASSASPAPVVPQLLADGQSGNIATRPQAAAA